MSEPKKPIDLGEVRAARTKGRVLVLEDADKIKQTAVEWIWLNRLAVGKMTIVGGAPSQGKTQVTIDTIARITTGRDWPDGGTAPFGSAIILSAEDAANDTICPRLELAGADLRKVKIVKTVLEDGKSSSLNLQKDLDSLGESIEQRGDVKIVVIDPITAYLGDVDSHRTTDIRSVLEPLDKFIQKHRVSLFAITHPPKAAQRAMNSFTGSLAFVAAPRLAFLVAPDPGTDRRLFLAVKNNIGPLASGLGYRIEGGTTQAGIVTSKIAWDNKPVRLTADEAMGEAEPVSSELRNAEKFLEDMLKHGPVLANEIYAAAAEEGISERTLNRAKASLKIKSDKITFQGRSAWKFPS